MFLQRLYNVIKLPIAIIVSLLLLPAATTRADIKSLDEAEKRITLLTVEIKINPQSADLYVKRGDLYFDTHDFDSAVKDYTAAISIDNSLDTAWFGRGMAQGRMGFISEGIDDLSVYIERNPEDSVALTKRGVRYLWIGDKLNAQRDLQKAIKIDPDNAEAHDDLGVVLSQKGDYKQAINHFRRTITLDPSYQKGHHNLAMALYITENDLLALASVNQSLALKPNSRGSLMLKSKILAGLGRMEEARQLEDEAIFLPEANWSETAPIE